VLGGASRRRFKRESAVRYRTEDDPWDIGEADSPRYDLYVDAIRSRTRAHETVLDLGCGIGAMLARLRADFARLHGIELVPDAIAKGTKRYPFIEFEQGSIEALDRTKADGDLFDVIICSDAIFYVDEAGRRAALRWIAEHLERNGFALIAGWSPGDRGHPSPTELRALVERELVIEREELLASGHLMLLAHPRRRLAALTLDYKSWQPLLAGRRIDWDADVFAPTDALLDACDAERVCLTIFADLGEHAYLREHEPKLASRMEAQWRDAIQRGHDVQMLVNPEWLADIGAGCELERYMWNELLTGERSELVAVIGSLKEMLEQVIRPVDPSYEAVAFRAGGCDLHPFRQLAAALSANGLWCDSSVDHGGWQPAVYHRRAQRFDGHQPWFASFVAPQLEAPPAECAIVELPVATFARTDRWTFDGVGAARFGERLVAAIEAERNAAASIELARIVAQIRQSGACAYHMARACRRLVNRVLPRRTAWALVGCPRARRVNDDFYVAVGHSNAHLDILAIRAQLRAMCAGGVEIVSLSEMARLARHQLQRVVSLDAESEACEQARIERTDVLGRECEQGQSRRLQAMIPLDRTRVLDLGCGIGASSALIAFEHPWLEVTGVDAGEELILAARERHACDRVDFAVAKFPTLPFIDGSFDCVCADNSLAYAFDVDATFAEVHRVLADGGLLLVAIPADAYGAQRSVVNHTWKTSPEDVRERLSHAGFLDVSVEDVDVYRQGGVPYPPALDHMLYARAWRRNASLTPVERIDALRRWTRKRLDPRTRREHVDIVQALGGDAPGSAMTLVLGQALVREGYRPRWITLLARDHPHGHGARMEATHEVVEVTLDDHTVHVIDPFVDVRFPYAVERLIDDPALADGAERDCNPVYPAHRCDLYSTSFWYQRVVAVAVRTRLPSTQHLVPASWTAHATEPLYQALAATRVRGWRAVRRLPLGY
jgi:SAM-dependent methyltransferase